MKILQVVPFFTPARGGSVIVPYCLSKELSKRGHEVTIITTDFEFDEQFANSIEKEGVEVIPFHCVANFGLFLYSPNMRKWLKVNIKNFDIIHLHNFRSYQNNIIHHYAKKYGIPYVLQPHGSLPRIGKQGLKKLYDRVWGYRILKDAAKVIALTKTEVEQFKQMGVEEDKIKIVPNGINLSEYENLPEKGEFRKKYGIEDSEKIILYLGRLHKTKGIDLLISAYADLIKELDNVRLVIVGPDDGFLPFLKKQVKDLKINHKVLFTGPLYDKEKLEAYVDADVFVNPRADEIFGIVVLESIMCATPCIATKGCGCGEIIKKANCGYLVRYGDINDLKEKMKWIFENPEKGERMVERGEKYIVENLAWNKVVRKVERLYENCIHNI